MLVQFHWFYWRNQGEPPRTEFVEQAEILSHEDHRAWRQSIDEKYAAESKEREKDGWTGMICDEGSEYFLKVAHIGGPMK